MYGYNRTSSAYDFSKFDTAVKEEKKPQIRAENHIKVHKVSVAKSGGWLRTFVFIAAMAVLALLFVNAKAVISELSTQISTSSSQLEEAKRENVRLQTELDNMVTLSKVEEMATSSLGLQKTAKTQVKYITVHDRTMVQSAGKDPNVFSGLKGWIDDTAEFLGF